jgi:hypothetical protein
MPINSAKSLNQGVVSRRSSVPQEQTALALYAPPQPEVYKATYSQKLQHFFEKEQIFE